jgi:hypothetical protein
MNWAKSYTTNRWTELGNGICYRDPLTGVWLDSEALVEPHPLGAIAQRSPHTVLFARDIATPGSIDILLPDRQTHLRGHPLGLFFYDVFEGNSQLNCGCRSGGRRDSGAEQSDLPGRFWRGGGPHVRL